jgi:hypothetical protein
MFTILFQISFFFRKVFSFFFLFFYYFLDLLIQLHLFHLNFSFFSFLLSHNSLYSTLSSYSFLYFFLFFFSISKPSFRLSSVRYISRPFSSFSFFLPIPFLILSHPVSHILSFFKPQIPSSILALPISFSIFSFFLINIISFVVIHFQTPSFPFPLSFSYPHYQSLFNSDHYSNPIFFSIFNLFISIPRTSTSTSIIDSLCTFNNLNHILYILI